MRRLRGIIRVRACAMLLSACAAAAALVGCGGSHGGTPSTSTAATTRAGGHTTPAHAGTHRSPTGADLPHPDLGPFAGYEWNLDVESVHADWTVPHLTAASPAGQAAAWVGAEAPGTTGRAPFVQVGVHEGDTDGPSSAPPDFYYAFYSTTKRHFRPVPLFAVQPGDVVSATLRRTGRRWRIEIDDLTTGRSRTVFSTEGAGRTFNEAQVNQEDVTDSRTGKPYPYPSLSALRFFDVSVSGGARSGGARDSSWLTEAGGYLAPGPLRHGAFALQRVTMTAAAYRYLQAIAAEDAATTGEVTAFERWASGGSAAVSVADARRLGRVLDRTESRLDTARWPQAARRPITALCDDARQLVSLLRVFAHVSADERVAWAERFYTLVAALGHEGRAARSALGLPSAATLPAG